MGDPTLVIVAEDVTEKFMPLGVTDEKRASSRLVWPKGRVVTQGQVDAFKERNEGVDVPLADAPKGVALVLGRFVDLDPRPAVDQSALPDAKTAVAGSVPQNPDAPGADASTSSSKARSTGSKGSAKDGEEAK